MEWSMLLVAAVLAASAVLAAHALRRHPDAATGPALDRRAAERAAAGGVTAVDKPDAGTAEQHPVERQRPD